MAEFVSTTKVANGTIVFTFYTDFERGHPSTKLSQTPVAGFWKFQTNLNWEDLTLYMSEVALKRFLYQMWDIYRNRKVQANG